MLPLSMPLTATYPYFFPPPPQAKRANTLLLKHKLVELLSPEQGQAYWTLLCNLVTGKITREEFELGWQEHLCPPSGPSSDPSLAGVDAGGGGTSNARNAVDEQLSYLHNALLLSILYNTTKPTLPPASVTHQGWTSKRKRDGVDTLGAAPGGDPLGEYARKRRRLKRMVAGMTKAEKKRLRLLLNNRGKKEDPLHVHPMNESIAEKTRLGLMPASAGLKTPNSAALQQELQRAQAIPTCLESGELPDLQSLTDRMTGVAYSTAMTGGVDPEAAALTSVALDLYMKDLLTGLLAVASAQTSQQPVPVKVSKKGKVKQQQAKPPTNINRNHLLSFLEISPSLLHANHVSSVEKFIAHQHLYDLPPREERVKQIEEGRSEGQPVVVPVAGPSKPPAVQVAAKSMPLGAPTSKLPNSPLKKEVIDSPPEQANADGTAMIGHTGKAKQKNGDLQFELFPELPLSAQSAGSQPNGQSPQKVVRTAKKNRENRGDSPSSEDENEPPNTAALMSKLAESIDAPRPAPSSAAAAAASSTATKEVPQKPPKKEQQNRGRFAIWSLLSSILDGTAGNQNHQGNHRFQHTGVL